MSSDSGSGAARKAVELLHRYTSLPSVIDMLQEKRLTLLDPASWDDRNDAFGLEEYRRQAGRVRVFALCFTEAEETYHHWRVFAPGSDGVRVTFYKRPLLRLVEEAAIAESDRRFRSKPVKYRLIRDITKRRIRLAELPFTKRKPYADECEFRIICESDDHIDAAARSRSLPLRFDCIERITLGPWLPQSLVAPIKKTLNAIDGCEEVKIYRTTLLENEQWKNAIVKDDSPS